MPEYEEALAALQADSVIRPQLETLVGTALQSRRVESDDIIEGPLRASIAWDQIEFDRDLVDSTYLAIESALYEESIGDVLIMPLLGFSSSHLPIVLSENTEIIRMNDRELRDCMRAGFIRPQFADLDLINVENATCAVRGRYSLKKRIGESTEGERDAAWAERGRVENEAEQVGQALRVFKAGTLSIPGILHVTPYWFLRGGVSWGVTESPQRRNPMFTLEGTEPEEFEEFWQVLGNRHVKADKALAGAFRRLDYTGERTRSDDRLVDALIAAESLFLNEAGDPVYRGELQYRLAIRAGAFLGGPEGSAGQVYDHMRRAYRARSALVHGSEPRAADLRLPDGSEPGLAQFTDYTVDLVRFAFKKAIGFGQAGKFPPDWETEMLSESGPIINPPS